MTQNNESNILRNAGPNEKRCITRHKLGLYSNLAVAAIYSIPEDAVIESRLQELDFYMPALTACVRHHPFLSAAIKDAGSNNPVYIKARDFNPRDHIRIHQPEELLSDNREEDNHAKSLFSGLFEPVHNSPSFAFSNLDTEPAWAVDVVLLPGIEKDHYHSVLICFRYSHSHGDGMSGTIFHHTFLNALQQHISDHLSASDGDLIDSAIPFPEQPDTSTSMPISLSYLLQPALGTYLPSFLTRRFGISANVSGSDDQTWTGSKTFEDDQTKGWKLTTGVKTVTIEPDILTQTLTLCKKNNTKMTSLLNYIIAQAMQAHFPQSVTDTHTNLISTIPLNLRRVLKAAPDTIGNYGGATYLKYDLDHSPTTVLSSPAWASIRTGSQYLASAASTARNQPIGLLRFISNFPNWLQGQIGQSRDCSWELSNLGMFNPEVNTDVQNKFSKRIKIEQILFSQPASAVGPPVMFNSIAIKGGPLNICVSWQPGALGFAVEGGKKESRGVRELRFVNGVCDSIRDSFAYLAREAAAA